MIPGLRPAKYEWLASFRNNVQKALQMSRAGEVAHKMAHLNAVFGRYGHIIPPRKL